MVIVRISLFRNLSTPLVEMMGFGRGANCAPWSSAVGNVHRKFPLFRFCSNPLSSESFDSVGGDDGIRAHDPLLAGQVLSQLSYTPNGVFVFHRGVFTLPDVLATTYLPVQSPAKYFRHCKA